MRRFDYLIYGLALLVSALAHTVLLEGASKAALRSTHERRKPVEAVLIPFEVKPEPIPEPPPLDLTKKIKPAPKRKPLKPAPPTVSQVPDPPAEDEPPPPVFGIAMSSATVPGQNSGFQVRVGNTTMKAPEKKFTAPHEVKAYNKPIHIAELTVRPKILRDFRPPYPKKAAALEIEGDIKLRLEIDVEGRVAKAEVIRGLGYGLDAAALSAVRKFLFSAGMRGTKKVRTIIVYTMRFELDL